MIRQILCNLGILALILGCFGDNKKKELKMTSETKDTQKTAYSLGVQYAKGLGELKFDEKDQKYFLKGLEDSFNSAIQLDNNDVQVYAKMADKVRQKNREDSASSESKSGSAALTKIMEEDPEINLHSSGMAYKILEQGDLIKNPKTGAFIGLSYESSHLNDEVYESTLTGNPRVLPLKGVFKAWQIAFAIAGAGGKIEIISPPDLTYGNNGALPYIQPGEYLKFKLNFSKYYDSKPESN